MKIDYPGIGNKSEFLYDSFWRNRKIVETVANSVTSTSQFIWSLTHRLEERDGTSSVTKRYFQHGVVDSGISYFYSKDHLGSIRSLTDSGSTLQSAYSYEPFGRATTLFGSVRSDFQFTGHYLHGRSNLDTTLLRAYAPQIGRWISRDPVEEAGGINVYSYVGSDPVDNIDPDGDTTLTLCLAIVILIILAISLCSCRRNPSDRIMPNNTPYYGNDGRPVPGSSPLQSPPVVPGVTDVRIKYNNKGRPYWGGTFTWTDQYGNTFSKDVQWGGNGWVDSQGNAVGDPRVGTTGNGTATGGTSGH